MGMSHSYGLVARGDRYLLQILMYGPVVNIHPLLGSLSYRGSLGHNFGFRERKGATRGVGELTHCPEFDHAKLSSSGSSPK